jgi:hypothetical protein
MEMFEYYYLQNETTGPDENGPRTGSPCSCYTAMGVASLSILGARYPCYNHLHDPPDVAASACPMDVMQKDGSPEGPAGHGVLGSCRVDGCHRRTGGPRAGPATGQSFELCEEAGQ